MATEPLYGVKVKDVDQTLDYILAHHSSVARFGDGEIDLIAGRDIPYQSYDPALVEHLKRVLYTPSRPELVVCMSDVFERLERYTPAAQAFWAQNRPANAAIYQLMGANVDWYGSTFISRPYMDWQDKSLAQGYFTKLRQLWADRDVLIVEGQLSRSGVGNDLFANAKSVQRILGPAHNAFAQYAALKAAIEKFGPGKLVLLMLGPTAKALVGELAATGLQLVDIGHIDSEYEWFQMGATSKVKLQHKHTAEHNFDEDITLTAAPEYEAQIIADLSQEGTQAHED
ncbi:SP_1767 family glycosyltransferase [Limosilactobacillus oris]|uniref:SP_1767 family glycosyltransferase n=1 Tax=Limosilactobacillus oris TaxID=1632 RepID=UPI0018833FCC|nr:SP_1767 family glycosyltransferase [Limosilactobacillus oris]MBF0601451.1 SP_1767 family glycosyltransferase [Limosilactobacillus oris]